MNMPPAIERLTARFDGMSLRERVLTASALLAMIVMIWMLAILDPIAAKQRALVAERTSLEGQIASTREGLQAASENDPTMLALAKEEELRATLATVDAKLASQSAGLIPPERMVQVIHDVLSRQHGVSLVSLHNKEGTSLVPPVAIAPVMPASDVAAQEAPSDPSADGAATPTQTVETGPYVHPVEIVVEGSYLDILAYLKALERLDWRFYWKVLHLETRQYPVNRVRIELSTLSMDKNWIGV
jgi:MSHA biogenesis protein MshJ